MRIIILCIGFALFVLAGCTSTPPKPNPTVVEREIVKSVLKELCVAVLNIQGGYAAGDPNLVREHLKANDGWIAEIETNLKTDEEASANPSATLVGPIIPGLLVPKGGTAGSYNLAAGGTIDQTATTLRDNKHYLVVQSLLADPELCPPTGTPAYNAYYNENAAYRSDGKFLTGKLGIYDWLYNGLSAHNFNSLIDPTTLVVQGPSVAEPTPRHQAGYLAPRFGHMAPNLLAGQIAIQGLATKLGGCVDCPRPTVSIPPQLWTQGSPPLSPLHFAFEDPKNLPLTYTANTEPGNGSLPSGLIFDPQAQTLTVRSVPSDSSFTSIKITATNSNKLSGSLEFPVVIAAAPKTTTWGPTYGAQFTFLLKGSGQIGPSFTFDRSKGGVANLFSVSRTETNYVNIALTAVGVPLLENYPSSNGSGTQISLAAASNPDAINAALDRLEQTLLKLNLSNIFVNSP
jgi:hypothetical protein